MKFFILRLYFTEKQLMYSVAYSNFLKGGREYDFFSIYRPCQDLNVFFYVLVKIRRIEIRNGGKVILHH